MEGLSVQAPACDDRSGHNDFEFSSPVINKVDDYLAHRREDRFIGFSFTGRIEKVGMQKRLVIERIGQMRGVEKPQWMTDLEQSYGRDRVTY